MVPAEYAGQDADGVDLGRDADTQDQAAGRFTDSSDGVDATASATPTVRRSDSSDSGDSDDADSSDGSDADGTDADGTDL